MASRDGEEGMPWWIMVALAFVLTNLASSPEWQGPMGGDRLKLGPGQPQERRLDVTAPFQIEKDSNGTGPVIALQVPCWLMVKPCGHVKIPAEGVTFTYPLGLGQYRIPGSDSLSSAVDSMDHAFSHYTLYVVIALAVLFGACKLCQSAAREKAAKKFRRLKDGVLDSDSDDDRPDGDPEKQREAEEERQARLDPKSNDFIAPGNIYRLLAIMHPGIIGWKLWCHYAFKAGVCAYMQLSLPFTIIVSTLRDWHITGIKSPVWFLSNSVTFASMMASLGSLTYMFQGKCADSIRCGAEANYYILTHYAPVQPPSGGCTARQWQPSPRLVCMNETIWCWTSILLNISMSMMLQACMFLKIATFTGAVDHVAMVCVSLYFIFDLDDKVMQADPKLRIKYRRGVARLTNEATEVSSMAKWLVRTASAWIAISHCLAPMMLLGLILFAWHNPALKVFIGGSGLEAATAK